MIVSSRFLSHLIYPWLSITIEAPIPVQFEEAVEMHYKTQKVGLRYRMAMMIRLGDGYKFVIRRS